MFMVAFFFLHEREKQNKMFSLTEAGREGKGH